MQRLLIFHITLAIAIAIAIAVPYPFVMLPRWVTRDLTTMFCAAFRKERPRRMARTPQHRAEHRAL